MEFREFIYSKVKSYLKEEGYNVICPNIHISKCDRLDEQIKNKDEIIFLRNIKYSNKGNVRKLPYEGLHAWAIKKSDLYKFFEQAHYQGADKHDFTIIKPEGKEIYALNFKKSDDYVKGLTDLVPELERFNSTKHVLEFKKQKGKYMYPYHSDLNYQILIKSNKINEELIRKQIIYILKDLESKILKEQRLISNEKYKSCYVSDLIRMDLIEDFFKKTQTNPSYNIKNPNYDSLLDAWNGYEEQSYIQNNLKENEIIYFEGWSESCFEGLYSKKEYKGMNKKNAIEKVIKERFPKIAKEFGLKIKNHTSFVHKTENEFIDDGYITKVVFSTEK